MIESYKSEDANWYSEGFDVKTDDLDVIISEGQLNYISDVTVHKPIYDVDGNITGEEESQERLIQTFNYPEFRFSVNPHDTKQVEYDVYLVQVNAKPVYQLDRTLLDGVVEPSFEGNGELLHTLLTIIVPPGVKSLEKVIVHVHRVDLANSNEQE